MPGGPRQTARPGAGPGRGRPRARSQASRSPGSGTGVATPPAAKAAMGSHPPTAAPATDRRRSGSAAGSTRTKGSAPAAPSKKTSSKAPRASLTGRAIALAVVILILVISYASSLRVYFAQAHEIAETKAEIAQRTQAIEDLQAERERWDNPDYVRAQARERLGWVVPGEIGLRVVDANGNPVGGGEQIDPGTTGSAPDKAAWWTKLRNSVAAADNPTPVPKKTEAPTVTVETKPGR